LKTVSTALRSKARQQLLGYYFANPKTRLHVKYPLFEEVRTRLGEALLELIE
jgi:hypothetical protein